MNKLFFGLFGSIYILVGIVLYKINNVQKEIEYFENQKGLFYTRKEYNKNTKKNIGRIKKKSLNK